MMLNSDHRLWRIISAGKVEQGQERMIAVSFGGTLYTPIRLLFAIVQIEEKHAVS